MKKVLIVSSICSIMLVVVYLRFGNKAATADPRGAAFAGAKTCAKCHAAIYNSYLHTAHFEASSAASENTIHGSFASNANVFNVNAPQKVVMEKRAGGLFQTFYVNGKFKESRRFDVALGGIKGESYLYWKGNELYQLPLSYSSGEHQWSTSPGMGSNFMDYARERPVGIRCLECHASYINYLPNQAQRLNGTEEFDKGSLVYHIDCERCHGPGAQHVDFHTRNPGVKTASFITTYASLNRGQKLDMCAVCHSGQHSIMLRPAFAFMPGDTFAKFTLPGFSAKIDTAHPDVHGNQLQLLKSSKCFMYSKMDCSTCHDTHQNMHGNDALYTQKCLSCHNSPNHTYCKLTNTLSAAALKTGCISCHMPALPTRAISVQVAANSRPVQFFVHTHHIAVYPQEVKKMLASVNLT
jgi:hypothetical protein